MKQIIFDIETKNIFADVGSDKAVDLDISVLSLYDSETNKYYSFQQDEFEKMWPFFENAEMLITFNGNHFDIPLLQKYTKINLSAIYHIDVFEQVYNSIGKRIGLDSIASNTLGTSKSANGLQAVAWWNSGEIDKIIKYCEQDVKVTKDVYEYALKNGELFYEDRKTKKREKISLNTSKWENPQTEEAPLTLF